MSIHASLQVRGIRLGEWYRDPALTTFSRPPFDGLLDLRVGLVLIAINSGAPGTGFLGNLFTRLEESADENRTYLLVSHIWNPRLADWLKRRGYEVSTNKIFGRCAMRIGNWNQGLPD